MSKFPMSVGNEEIRFDVRISFVNWNQVLKWKKVGSINLVTLADIVWNVGEFIFVQLQNLQIFQASDVIWKFADFVVWKFQVFDGCEWA